MSIKDGIRGIVGKTITGVVASRNRSDPRQQLFLVFSDGTSYELYSSSGDLHSASGLDRGDADAARRYALGFQGEVTVYP
jgi:hypothetical protein